MTGVREADETQTRRRCYISLSIEVEALEDGLTAIFLDWDENFPGSAGDRAIATTLVEKTKDELTAAIRSGLQAGFQLPSIGP